MERGADMTDRPIIFSGPMVRALLEGRKTQTRRMLKDRGSLPNYCGGRYDDKSDLSNWGWEDHDRGEWITLDQFKTYRFVPCSPGDRLYVREAFRCNGWATDVVSIFYRASEGDGYTAMCEQFPVEGKKPLRPDGKWSPSIHMPRWASRLTLTVTDVRVQRLQDISQEDAVSEGVERLHGGYHDDDDVYLNYLVKSDGFGGSGAGRASFRTLWNSLHGIDAWEANPWVYAVSFNVQRGNIDQSQES